MHLWGQEATPATGVSGKRRGGCLLEWTALSSLLIDERVIKAARRVRVMCCCNCRRIQENAAYLRQRTLLPLPRVQHETCSFLSGGATNPNNDRASIS